LAEAAHRQYTAIFAVGGKLLGSFKGTMVAAEARLQRLRTAAVSFGKTMLKIAGAFGGLGAVFAGLGISKMLSSLFSGATEAAEAFERQTKIIQFTLLRNNKIMAAGHGDMKKSLAFAKAQEELIVKHNEHLAEQGVLSERVLNAMAAQMATLGVPPRQIMQATNAMADLLVATKGVSASEEEATSMATLLTRAIMKGKPTRALEKLGIFLPKDWGKQYATFQQRFDNIIKRLAWAKGRNLDEVLTPLGRIQKMRNELERTRKEIGEQMLPIQAKMADMWRTALPEIKPVILDAINLLGKGVDYVVRQGREMMKVLQGPKAGQAWSDLLQNVRDLGAAFGLALPKGKSLGKWLGEELVKSLGDVNKMLGSDIEDIKRFKDGIDLLTKAVEGFLPKLREWLQYYGFAAVPPSPPATLMTTTPLPPGVRAAAAYGGGARVPASAPATQRAVGGSAGVRQGDVDQAADALGLPPGFASGGIAMQPQITTVAERGPEAIIPLTRLASTVSRLWSMSPQAKLRADYSDTPRLASPTASRIVSTTTAPVQHINFSPSITINGNATEPEQRAMDARLRLLANDFIKRFTAAQYQERRLSYEGGYG
jgi:hypothetical protein